MMTSTRTVNNYEECVANPCEDCVRNHSSMWALN